jgi:ABC-type spermidine/putrescine transport system permease subunit I
VLDEYGNRLVELAVPRGEIARPARRVAHVPLYRRGRTWLVATAAVATTGVVFGYLANRADDDAARFASTSETHAFGDYTDAIDRRDRYALIANSFFVAGGVLAAATVIAYLTEPAITPMTSRDTVGLVVTRSF